MKKISNVFEFGEFPNNCWHYAGSISAESQRLPEYEALKADLKRLASQKMLHIECFLEVRGQDTQYAVVDMSENTFNYWIETWEFEGT